MNTPADSTKSTARSGLTPREYEIVQEFAKAKLESQSEMQYENLEEYEVPPRTQFSMLKKPSVSIKYNEFLFNMTAIRLFDGITQIVPSINRRKKRFAVLMRKEETASTVEWAKVKEKGIVNKTIRSLQFTDAIFEMMGWDKNTRYKVLGRVTDSSEGLILVFDLEEAIKFDALPEEYFDVKTGTTKKRRKVYYPEKYRNRIGNYYNDYIAAEQISMFENLDEYPDAPASPETPRSDSAITGTGGENNG